MRPHSHSRPLSALPGRKRDHPDADETDVGVDAVLSADVGDAPMRQRQYTAAFHGGDVTLRNGIEDWTDVDFQMPSHREAWTCWNERSYSC